MVKPVSRATHVDLQETATRIMREHGFNPEFSADVQRQLVSIAGQAPVKPTADIRDLRSVLWSSIDNDTSRDLDQIEWAEPLPNGDIRVLIGIADVDAFVP